ncbi:MAG: bifunctional 5,10-methylenetetrahydrofolate dehydrogenase/5,10-methenyltetrahydrofolate cyclohydrolase [Candidatus Cloacimonetes bacterium]|nr:bifunctional 5,10-methylenetetrahydrofolate dehydrogenase/5,10-methenyltetrahydrofolate cyclohydrolase [Candidatus Cloacimonadota bacterium]
MVILKAKPITKDKYELLSSEIRAFGVVPSLTVVMIGNDPAAEYYVQNLVKFGAKIGVEVNLTRFESTISENELILVINELNQNKNVHGIMLQKPLPKHIDENKIVNAITPFKDVDGFHPYNLGNLFLEESNFIPCTPAAVLEILDYYQIATTGKHIVIIGRSNIVGKPLANLFLRKDKTGNATVTICHSKTDNLVSITSQADILVAAIGIPEFVEPEMIKEGAVVIDVGINEIETETGDKIYVGDVAYEACLAKCSAITPVPGGVGSVTTYNLLKNVFVALRLNYA